MFSFIYALYSRLSLSQQLLFQQQLPALGLLALLCPRPLSWHCRCTATLVAGTLNGLGRNSGRGSGNPLMRAITGSIPQPAPFILPSPLPALYSGTDPGPALIFGEGHPTGEHVRVGSLSIPLRTQIMHHSPAGRDAPKMWKEIKMAVLWCYWLLTASRI